VNYLLQIPFTIPEIVLVSLLYLFLDIYPAVKSFRAMLTTASFLLLWATFSVLTGIAYFFLITTSVANVQSLVGPIGTKLTIIFLAALMGATILQSLSLKISDVKIVNLQALLDGYRGQVLADITKRNSQIEQLSAFRLGDQLAKKFQNNVNELAEEYSQLLLFTGQTKTSAAQFVAAIEQEATDLKISKVKLISGRIARLDGARGRQLLS
jgi:hypothetical protein